MAIDDYLKTQKKPATGDMVKFKSPVAGGDTSYGSLLSNSIADRKANSAQFQKRYQDEKVADLASTITQKSAGRVPLDEHGIPIRKPTAFSDNAKTRLSTIDERGKLALQTEEAKAEFQKQKQLEELQNSYNVAPGTSVAYDPKNLPAGASADNVGGQAVAIAMTAYENGTPYVWGGNSLTGGVDCSGLVQQTYRQLGIELPRTTYEQAKSGKPVPLSNLLPGDLVFFYNANDPNGIKANSHVGIYIGNGQMVEAKGTKYGMRVSSISGATGAVRPW